MPDQVAWHRFEKLETTSENGIRAEVTTEQGSQWFSGHFRDDPVLPGIAQLAMVAESVARTRGSHVGVEGFKRVRFRQIIRPDDRLFIAVLPANKGNYSFSITVGQDVACTGILITKDNS